MNELTFTHTHPHADPHISASLMDRFGVFNFGVYAKVSKVVCNFSFIGRPLILNNNAQGENPHKLVVNRSLTLTL